MYRKKYLVRISDGKLLIRGWWVDYRVVLKEWGKLEADAVVDPITEWGMPFEKIKSVSDFKPRKRKIRKPLTEEQLIERRKKQRELYANRKGTVYERRAARRRHIYYERNKERLNKKRSENKKNNKEREQARFRQWYRDNQEREFSKITERRKNANPAYGLHSAISEYRRGRITLDVLARRCEDAGARADKLSKPAHVKRKNKPRIGS
jgi:hypothetical protein